MPKCRIFDCFEENGEDDRLEYVGQIQGEGESLLIGFRSVRPDITGFGNSAMGCGADYL